MGDSGETVNASHARDVIVRPCPKLFPSFTVTWPELDAFCRIYAKAKKDTYLPDAYRKPGKAEPYRGIVADTKAYAMNVPEKEPSDEERIARAISRTAHAWLRCTRPPASSSRSTAASPRLQRGTDARRPRCGGRLPRGSRQRACMCSRFTERRNERRQRQELKQRQKYWNFHRGN